jgi:hypothetical protein
VTNRNHVLQGAALVALPLLTALLSAPAWAAPGQIDRNAMRNTTRTNLGHGGGGNRPNFNNNGGNRPNFNNNGNRPNFNNNNGGRPGGGNRPNNRPGVNVNQNTNVNVNVNHGHGGGYYGNNRYDRGPSVAGVIAATVATAIVVGAIVQSLPPNCSTVVANGIAYQNCGGTYYQPQYQGGGTSYVVVNQP